MNNEHEVSFPALIQDFFSQRLIAQQNVSPQTIASYRDTFRLLFQYTKKKKKKEPASLQLTDINATLVLDFLEHLENERGNTPRSRNVRLAAIRSFMNYASYRNIEALSSIRKVLAIPLKRFDRPSFEFLLSEEIEAIITSPDKSTFSGHRDYVMFTMLYNTGARVSEIIRLQYKDLCLENSTFIVIHGKGRKQRSVPLWKSTAKHMQEWCSRLNPAENDHEASKALEEWTSEIYLHLKPLALLPLKDDTMKRKRLVAFQQAADYYLITQRAFVNHRDRNLGKLHYFSYDSEVTKAKNLLAWYSRLKIYCKENEKIAYENMENRTVKSWILDPILTHDLSLTIVSNHIVTGHFQVLSCEDPYLKLHIDSRKILYEEYLKNPERKVLRSVNSTLYKGVYNRIKNKCNFEG